MRPTGLIDIYPGFLHCTLGKDFDAHHEYTNLDLSNLGKLEVSPQKLKVFGKFLILTLTGSAQKIQEKFKDFETAHSLNSFSKWTHSKDLHITLVKYQKYPRIPANIDAKFDAWAKSTTLHFEEVRAADPGTPNKQYKVNNHYSRECVGSWSFVKKVNFLLFLFLFLFYFLKNSHSHSFFFF
mgnify:CR=1 FL=1